MNIMLHSTARAHYKIAGQPSENPSLVPTTRPRRTLQRYQNLLLLRDYQNV